ncbi:MAG: hypothetical protein JWQ04_1251 [Pedosphaera sp.]|nr:hypothetical protein [Pedosphaera sp.]
MLLALMTFSSCHGREDPGEVLSEAKQDAVDGNFEQALNKHIWFHEHSLDKDPSYYGVRLSFALSDWMELGKKYPKALEELKKIRDKDTALLAGGQGNEALFHDVEAINKQLGETDATVDLFKQIDQARPEFAASIYYLAEEALITAGKYPLAKKYLGNPQDQFATARRNYESGLQFSAVQAKDSDVSRHAFETIFTEKVVRLITVLDKTGDHKQALEIQSQALKLLNSGAIKAAIN